MNKSVKLQNIKINALLNVIKSCLSVVFPLVTYPIVLQNVGTVGIGKISFVQSIISYFAMFAMLGVSTYSAREGAVIRGDAQKLSSFVSEVLTINVITTTIAYCALSFLVIVTDKLRGYSLLFLILGLNIIFRTFSVEWINAIFEDYFFITIRSVIVYIINLILIIILIKQPSDYLKYAVLLVLSNGILCISNFFYCRKYINIRLTKSINLKKHIQSLTLLFFNAVLVSIYVNFDTTMLGWIKGDYYVGIYSLSVRVYTIIKTVLSAVYAVTTARLSLYAGSENWKEYKSLFSNICGTVTIILIPVSAGILGLSNEIVLFLGGNQYVDSIKSLRILSIALVFSIFSGMVTGCMNVPLKREKDLLISSTISAVINCGLNLLFIPWLNCEGAAITTVISEAFVFLFCFIRIPNKKNYIIFANIRKDIEDAILGVLIVLICTLMVRHYLSNLYTTILLAVINSVALYTMVLIVRKNEHMRDIINIVKKYFR